ncbi:MAG: hypothetical protein LBU41_00590 [Clostridiales Family XIII bacterium]|jgi:hypothetical protein|nr:hypothetical protein [Clostridiales Family XIII bacterium]
MQTERDSEKQADVYERINLIITYIERGKADSLIHALRELGVTFNMATVGYMAVGSEWAALLGLAEQEQDIVFSIVTESKRSHVLSMIEYKFSFDEPGKGMAVSVPIAGVGGPVSLKYLSGVHCEHEEE